MTTRTGASVMLHTDNLFCGCMASWGRATVGLFLRAAYGRYATHTLIRTATTPDIFQADCSDQGMFDNLHMQHNGTTLRLECVCVFLVKKICNLMFCCCINECFHLGKKIGLFWVTLPKKIGSIDQENLTFFSVFFFLA